MYFSRIQIRLNYWPAAMSSKQEYAGAYAWHQWLWQLFAEGDQTGRPFLFHRDTRRTGDVIYLLSDGLPARNHELFAVETKPYQPVLTQGMVLQYLLRANPVVTRQGKRCDVVMDAKYQAKHRGEARELWWDQQERAAQRWLTRQGEQHGFHLEPEQRGACQVLSYQQHQVRKRMGLPPIHFSTVDYAGRLTITDPARFLTALQQGLGKCKALGCGLLLIKKR